MRLSANMYDLALFGFCKRNCKLKRQFHRWTILSFEQTHFSQRIDSFSSFFGINILFPILLTFVYIIVVHVHREIGLRDLQGKNYMQLHDKHHSHIVIIKEPTLRCYATVWIPLDRLFLSLLLCLFLVPFYSTEILIMWYSNISQTLF